MSTNDKDHPLRTGRADARELYGDIIDLPRPVSTRHPHMSEYDRAAQFSPFAALTGYHEMIDDKAKEHAARAE